MHRFCCRAILKKFQKWTYYVITNERDRIRNFRYSSNGPDGSPRPSTKFCEKTWCATLTLRHLSLIVKCTLFTIINHFKKPYESRLYCHRWFLILVHGIARTSFAQFLILSDGVHIILFCSNAGRGERESSKTNLIRTKYGLYDSLFSRIIFSLPCMLRTALTNTSPSLAHFRVSTVPTSITAASSTCRERTTV